MTLSRQDAIRRRQEYEARQKAQQARVKEAQRLKDIERFRKSQYAQGAEDLDDMAALGLGRQLREQEERQARQEKTAKQGLDELLRIANPEEWVKFKANEQMINYRPGVGQQPDRAQLEASFRDQSQFSERERTQRAVEEGRNKPQPPKMVQMSDLAGLPKAEQERLLPYVGKANPFENLRNTLSQAPQAPQAPAPSRSGGRQGIRPQQPAQQQPQTPQQSAVSDDVKQLSQFIVSQIGTKPKQQPQQQQQPAQQQQQPQQQPPQQQPVQEPSRPSAMNRGMMRQDLERDPNRSLQQLQQQRPQITRR